MENCPEGGAGPVGEKEKALDALESEHVVKGGGEEADRRAAKTCSVRQEWLCEKIDGGGGELRAGGEKAWANGVQPGGEAVDVREK
jgi:hypothetical protein